MFRPPQKVEGNSDFSNIVNNKGKSISDKRSSSTTANHNLFYWMYKTTEYDTAPIAIWLNGGPGASSAFGNFLLNGPLKISETIDSSSGSDVYSFTIANA